MSAMSTKRVVAGFLATAALGGLAACGSDDEKSSSSGSATTTAAASGSEAGGKIAFLLPENKTARYEEQDRPAFVAKVKELCPKCEVIYQNAAQDPAKQQQQVESALTQGAKVLVLDAVDVKAAASSVARAKQSGVPVISYGRLVSDADLDYYVSIDPFKVGQQQAQVLLKATKAKGVAAPRVIMINGSPTDSNAAPYKAGARDVLDKAGAKIVKQYDTADWSPDKAQQEMEQAITAVGKNGFDAVYVANDGMASGAIAAMKAAGINPADRPVTGQDAEVAGVQRILAGSQLMTVYQPIAKIADAAAELAVPLAQGKQPPAIAKAKTDNGQEQVPSVLLDTIAITKDNVKSTVVADGFVKPADLCTGTYAKDCAAAGIS